MNAEKRWRKKQQLAAPGRYYGDLGTVHDSDHLDVEIHQGRVVAVWFRCQSLPYHQVDVDAHRAQAVQDGPEPPRLTGVEVLDPIPEAGHAKAPAGMVPRFPGQPR